MSGDGKFVFLLSDANLRRYGISGQLVISIIVSPCGQLFMQHCGFSFLKYLPQSQMLQHLQCSLEVSVLCSTRCSVS
jgi:hypothetical protein